MSDTALEVLCGNWGHLGSLRLASCERLTDRSLLAMSGLPSLYHLSAVRRPLRVHLWQPAPCCGVIRPQRRGST